MAIFMISDGWMLVTPRFNQRRAPLRISPNRATAINNNNPSM